MRYQVCGMKIHASQEMEQIQECTCAKEKCANLFACSTATPCDSRHPAMVLSARDSGSLKRGWETFTINIIQEIKNVSLFVP
jgi:hypothetical protein